MSLDVRLGIIGSIFSEKIEFDGTNYRTTKLNDVAAPIFNNVSELQKEKRDADRSTSRSVPPAKLITNSFLRDLDKIWALRFIIPDPKKHKWILNDVL